jgi:hypothetical protein
MSILAFLCRNANTSISKRYFLRNWYISSRSYESWIAPNFIPRMHCMWTLVHGRNFIGVGETPNLERYSHIYYIA